MSLFWFYILCILLSSIADSSAYSNVLIKTNSHFAVHALRTNDYNIARRLVLVKPIANKEPKTKRRQKRMKQQMLRKMEFEGKSDSHSLFQQLKPHLVQLLHPVEYWIRSDILPVVDDSICLFNHAKQQATQQWFEYKMHNVENTINIFLDGSIVWLEDKYHKRYQELIEPFQRKTNIAPENDADIVQNPFVFLKEVPQNIWRLLSDGRKKSVMDLIKNTVPPLFQRFKRFYKELIQFSWNRAKTALAAHSGVESKSFVYLDRDQRIAQHVEEPRGEGCMSGLLDEFVRQRAFDLTTDSIDFAFYLIMDHIDELMRKKIETFFATDVITDEQDTIKLLQALRRWIRERIVKFFSAMTTYIREDVLGNLLNHVKGIVSKGINVHYDEIAFKNALRMMSPNDRRGKRDKWKDWKLEVDLRNTKINRDKFRGELQSLMRMVEHHVHHVQYKVQRIKQIHFDYKMKMVHHFIQKWLEKEIIRFQKTNDARYSAFIRIFQPEQDNRGDTTNIFEDMKHAPIRILKLLKDIGMRTIRNLIEMLFPPMLKSLKNTYKDLMVESLNSAMKIMAWSEHVQYAKWEFVEQIQQNTDKNLTEVTEKDEGILRRWFKDKALKMSEKTVEIGFPLVISHIKSSLNRAVDKYIDNAPLESDTRNLLKRIKQWIKLRFVNFFKGIIQKAEGFIKKRMQIAGEHQRNDNDTQHG